MISYFLLLRIINLNICLLFSGSICNETCTGDSCQSPNYEPPAIFPSYSIPSYTYVTVNHSPTYGGFYSTPLQTSAFTTHHISSSRIILPEQMDSNNTSFSIQSNFSFPVPEQNHFNVDGAINVTQTSMSLSFSLIQPTSSLEPYSTIKTSFLPEHFFQESDNHNESVNLPSFARSAQFSKVVEKTSSDLHSFSIKVESKTLFSPYSHLSALHLAIFSL